MGVCSGARFLKRSISSIIWGVTAQVVLQCGRGANHAMADGSRGGEIAGVEQIRNHLEGDGTVGQPREIDRPACCLRRPLIQNLPCSVPMPSTAPS